MPNDPHKQAYERESIVTKYLVCLIMIVTCYLLIEAMVLWKNQGLYDNFWTTLSKNRSSISIISARYSQTDIFLIFDLNHRCRSIFFFMVKVSSFMSAIQPSRDLRQGEKASRSTCLSCSCVFISQFQSLQPEKSKL